jgi:hypothetical protein
MRFKFHYPRVTEYVKDGIEIRGRVSQNVFVRCDGLFDIDSKGSVIFIFGKHHTFKSLIDTINHESIHWVLEKIEGDYTSAIFDNICLEAGLR